VSWAEIIDIRIIDIAVEQPLCEPQFYKLGQILPIRTRYELRLFSL